MVGVAVVGEPRIEIERDPPFRQIEGEFPESTIIVFPTAMFLFEVSVAKLLDRFAQRHLMGAELLASECRSLERDARCREFHLLIPGQRSDEFDLAAVTL